MQSSAQDLHQQPLYVAGLLLSIEGAAESPVT